MLNQGQTRYVEQLLEKGDIERPSACVSSISPKASTSATFNPVGGSTTTVWSN
jgi:hypothetical protein